jgi:hypothetical protein
MQPDFGQVLPDAGKEIFFLISHLGPKNVDVLVR